MVATADNCEHLLFTDTAGSIPFLRINGKSFKSMQTLSLKYCLHSDLNLRVEKNWEKKMLLPVNPKENQSWIFIGMTDAEAATPIFWPPDVILRLEKYSQDGSEVVYWP